MCSIKIQTEMYIKRWHVADAVAVAAAVYITTNVFSFSFYDHF